MLPLKDIYLNSIEDERVALNRISSANTPPIQSKSDKAMLWYYNENMALGEFFIYNNLIRSKLDAIPNNLTADEAYSHLMDILNEARQAIINNPDTHLNDLIF